jgi:long-chain acyl-CoA synthetase
MGEHDVRIGGFTVDPQEVEDVLREHPSVVDAAVVGVASGADGKALAAAVVLAQGARTTAEELMQFVKAQVATYKSPQLIWFVSRLPRSTTGSVVKSKILPPVAGEQ